jgi:polyisoprenyl-phosphate glycosyltransferase
MNHTSNHISAAARPSLSDALVSVVLPVYNEAGVLPALVASLTKALAAAGVGHEVIFVNDGSTDDSPEVLDRLACENPRIRVLHLSRNFGHQAAVQAGLAHARGDAVVLMDSDLQDSPEAIGRFLADWQAGYDVVYAIRTDRKEIAPKRFLFAAFHRFLAWIASPPIPVDAGNFGLIDGRVVREIVALGERDRYLPGLRAWVGFRQKGVEVPRHARYDGRPRVPLGGLWRLAKTAIYSFSSFPLRVFHLIGCTAAGVFVLLGAYALFCKLFTSLAIPGWTSYILTGAFFGALNALGISILGEYVIRIYDQVRNRPLYLVDRTVNVEETVFQLQTSDAWGDLRDAELLEEATALADEAASMAEEGTTAIDVTPPRLRG